MKSRRIFLQAGVPLAAFAQEPQPAVRQPQVPFRPRPKDWKADWYRLNWEAEKLEQGIQTDGLVIHHTAEPPGITWQKLSDLQLDRLYANPKTRGRFSIDDPDPYVKGLTATSGHYRLANGRMVEVFYAYHWLIRQSGAAERLLNDDEVGWHAGNWAWNMHTLGLCFDGDFSTTTPSEAALKSCAKLIADYSKQFPLKYLKGHNDVRPELTRCPGDWFYNKSQGGKTGRDRLLEMSGVTLLA